MENGPSMASKANKTENAHKGACHKVFASGFTSYQNQESCCHWNTVSVCPLNWICRKSLRPISATDDLGSWPAIEIFKYAAAKKTSALDSDDAHADPDCICDLKRTSQCAERCDAKIFLAHGKD